VANGRFNSEVALPKGLEHGHIRRAIDKVEEELAGWIDLYHEQMNVFSAVVGIAAARVLSSVSPYEKNRNPDTAQQRFPDLLRRGASKPPSPHDCLEVKGSKRAYELQSHYDHAGWYIVWRYMVDPTETIEPGKPVLITRVDVVFLESSDWKYQRSGAGEAGGGRTHTFGVPRARERLQGKAVYERTDVRLKNGKWVAKNGH
jgi:hypothetical protein